MRRVVVSRQLAAGVAASALVVVATVGIFFVMMRQSMQEAQRASTVMASGLTRSYALLEASDEARSVVQRVLRLRDPDELEKAVTDLAAKRKSLGKLLDDAGDAGATIKAKARDLEATESQVIEAALRGDLAGASERFLTVASAQYDGVQGEIRKYQEHTAAAGLSQLATLEATQRRSLIWVGGFVLVLLVALVLFQLRTRSRLVSALVSMTTALRRTSERLANASGQVASTSHSVSQGSTEQAAALEETSASLEEMGGMARQSSSDAEHAKALAAAARRAAEGGESEMAEMGAAIDQIREASTNIGKIIKTIDEIAFQTNILALNAAVEAARAGEAGAGFAVVADEVRSLAQRAAQAAQDTTAKIEDSVAKSARGVALRDKVVVRLHEIVAKAREVDGLVSQIEGASQQQRQGIEQVSSAVSQMEKVTQAGAASAEEAAAASEELNGEAIAVNELVANLVALVGARASETADEDASADEEA